jgi:hypothetical protein
MSRYRPNEFFMDQTAEIIEEEKYQPQQQVGNDSSGYYSRDVKTSSLSTLQGKAGEEGRPGGCLRRAAYTRPSATPAGN